MVTSEYTKFFSRFYSEVRDYVEFTNMSEEDMVLLEVEWLHSAFGRPKIKKLFNTVSFDDDALSLNWELKCPTDKLVHEDDSEFVIQIIAIAMKIEWLEPKLHSTLNTMQIFGGKEEKFYSQANHIVELRNMLKDAKVELQQYINQFVSQNNSYLQSGDNV